MKRTRALVHCTCMMRIATCRLMTRQPTITLARTHFACLNRLITSHVWQYFRQLIPVARFQTFTCVTTFWGFHTCPQTSYTSHLWQYFEDFMPVARFQTFTFVTTLRALHTRLISDVWQHSASKMYGNIVPARCMATLCQPDVWRHCASQMYGDIVPASTLTLRLQDWRILGLLHIHIQH